MATTAEASGGDERGGADEERGGANCERLVIPEKLSPNLEDAVPGA
jgi:hypothetical protein